jgi:hypothetical protein
MTKRDVHQNCGRAKKIIGLDTFVPAELMHAGIKGSELIPLKKTHSFLFISRRQDTREK